MNIVKSPQSGKYVAKISTSHGRRTIQLGTTNYSDAKKIAKTTGIADVELIARTGKVRKELLSQVILGRKVPLSEAVHEFKDWLAARVSPKHARNVALILSAWEHEGRLARTHTHEITEKHIDKWINGSGDDKASTRKLKLAAIRKFFDFCSIRNYTVGNPAAELRVSYDGLSQEQKLKDVREPFSPEEYELLQASYDAVCAGLQRDIATAHSHLAAAIKQGHHTEALDTKIARLTERLRRHRFFQLASQISWSTGLRLGDVCQLEKVSIKHPGRILHVTEKTDMPVSVPIKPGLQAQLRAMAQLSDNQFIFPQEAAEYADISKRSSFSKEFERFLKQKAGIEGRSFHSLRHGYASQSVKKSVPMAHVQKRLGHASVETTKVYVHE